MGSRGTVGQPLFSPNNRLKFSAFGRKKSVPCRGTLFFFIKPLCIMHCALCIDLVFTRVIR